MDLLRRNKRASVVSTAAAAGSFSSVASFAATPGSAWVFCFFEAGDVLLDETAAFFGGRPRFFAGIAGAGAKAAASSADPVLQSCLQILFEHESPATRRK